MLNEKILSFSEYHKIFEADESTVSAADQILDLFFQAYFALVTKIGDYKEAGNDLTNLAKSDNKGKTMEEIIKKIASKVDPKYSESATLMAVGARKLKDAYEVLLKTIDPNTDEGKKSLEEIKDKIYDGTIKRLPTLQKTAKESPKINDGLNYEEQGHLFIFEKNTFKDERQELISKITPILSNVTHLGNFSPSESLKKKCLEIAKKLKSYQDNLGNESEWESKKRKERISVLEETQKGINDLVVELNQEQMNSLVKMGIDNKVQSEIKTASESILKALESLEKEEKIQIVDNIEDKEDKGKEKEKEKTKNEEKKIEYTEIKSGNIEKANIAKNPSVNKRKDEIKNYQEKMNAILPEGKKLAKTDGQYGNKTEEAVREISKMFGSLIPEISKLDGKSMTPDFLKFVNNFENKKEEISKIFKR